MKSQTKTAVKWFNTASAAVHLGFVDLAGQPKLKAFYQFLRTTKNPPTVHWLAGRMRFREVDLDRCLEPEPAARLTLVAVGERRR